MWPFSTANERQAEAMSMILAENAYERRLEHQVDSYILDHRIPNISRYGRFGYLGRHKPRSSMELDSGEVK